MEFEEIRRIGLGHFLDEWGRVLPRRQSPPHPVEHLVPEDYPQTLVSLVELGCYALRCYTLRLRDIDVTLPMVQPVETWIPLMTQESGGLQFSSTWHRMSNQPLAPSLLKASRPIMRPTTMKGPPCPWNSAARSRSSSDQLFCF